MPPPVTTNLRAQFDASAFVGLANGDLIASWVDQTANAYTLSQSTVGRRPIYRTNIFKGSLPAAEFSPARVSSIQGNIGFAWSNYQQYSTFTVFRANTTIGGGDRSLYGSTIHGNTSIPSYGMWMALRDGEVRQWAHTTNPQGGVQSTGAGIVNGSDYIISNFSQNGTANAGRIEVDGVNVLTQNPSTSNPLGVFCIGDLRDGRGICFDGWIGEILVYDRVLTSEEAVSTESYLRSKWIASGNTHYIMSGGSFTQLASKRVMVGGIFQEIQ